MPHPPPLRTAFSPGRVNVIGDHTDYTGGLALPLAIDLGVTVSVRPSAGALTVRSQQLGEAVLQPSEVTENPAVIAAIEPSWARLVAASLAVAGATHAATYEITSTLPVGIGLSSSAALCVALIELTTQATLDGTSLARLAQQAEHCAGIPVGLLDQLICAEGQAGRALMLDLTTTEIRPIAIPDDLEIVIVDSGVSRTLAGSTYARRVEECRAVEQLLGPLSALRPEELHLGVLAGHAVEDASLLERRARHIVTENQRVREMVAALEENEGIEAGRLLTASHRSLADEYEVSTPALDALVARLCDLPGVFGARMTGAGFGGCVVALVRPGTEVARHIGRRAWVATPSDGVVARRTR